MNTVSPFKPLSSLIRTICVICGLVICATLFSLVVADDNSVPHGMAAANKVKSLSQQLGDDDWEKRETAQNKLVEICKSLINQYRQVKFSADKGKELKDIRTELEQYVNILKEARKDKDPEIRMRIVRIILPFLHQMTTSKIAFLSPAPHQICIMDADGKNRKQLTNKGNHGYQTWSPDGQKIAFASNQDGDYEIYIMDIDGNILQKLTDNKADDTHPSWSPDGQKIGFMSNQDGNNEIYLMDSDGKNQERLTNNNTDDGLPVWSPDGTKIAFESNRDGRW